MRLCYVAHPYSIHTERWIRHFAERGHEIHLIGVCPNQGHLPSVNLPPGVNYYDLMTMINVRKIRYLVWGILARRIVREVEPDVLHAHQIAGDGWVGAAAGYHPFVVTAWGSDLLAGPQRSWAQRQLARWVLRRADHVTCVSESLARAARSLGASPEALEVAPWGIDVSVFHPQPTSSKRALRRRLGLKPGPTVISLRPIKSVYNPLDVAQAIPRVLEQVPEARFVIRTYNYDDALLDEFQAAVERYESAVQYIGDLSDEEEIAHLYRACDVAVSVPSSDGTPSSVLEALACGTVPVLSDVQSLHEWVQHEQEGLFVPKGDSQAVAAAIVRLLRHKTLRDRLRNNGLEMIQQRADSRTLMRQAEHMYRRLADG